MVPIYTLDGNGRTIEVFEDHIVLTVKGFFNKILGEVKGSKTIPFDSITAIQLKKPGITTGFLQFSVSGTREAKLGVFNAVNDENTFPFVKNLELVVKIKNYIESQKKVIKSLDGNIHSAADEIKKLGELKNQNLITDEEFISAKKKILGI